MKIESTDDKSIFIKAIKGLNELRAKSYMRI